MLRTRLTFTACGLVLIAALAGVWRLHAVNRDREVDQFQDHQLHTVQTIAAVLRSELTGSARTLRALADEAADGRDVGLLAARLQREMRCAAPPCFSGLAIYDARGAAVAAAGRKIPFETAEIRPALEWAHDPAHASAVRAGVANSHWPSLVLLTPVPVSGGFAAVEMQLDTLFENEPPLNNGAAVLVLDGRGDVMFRSGRPEMRLNNVSRRGPRCYTCHESFAHIDRMVEMKRGVLEYTVRGVHRLGAVDTFDFEGEHWITALTAPTESAVGVLSSEMRQVGLVIFATVLALGVAVQLTWRDTRRRLEEEAEESRRAHLERSHAELTALNAKLESAAIEWRTTVDTIDVAVIVLEPTGSIERMNRAAAETLPGPPFSWLGEPSQRLTAYPPWDSALALARDAADRGAASTARVRHTASGRTWDLWCRTPRGRGRADAVVIVARDVTALLHLQESLRRSETMAALGLVVAGVAHEVRNPLFAISSLVDAWSLQTHADPTPLISALRGEVARVKTLMTELLEYGTPTASVLRAQPLAPVMDQAVRACAHDIETRRVRVVSHVPADLELWLDARRLVRVFINVIQNAVQHAPVDSEVTITVEQPSLSSVEIAVRDHGHGFCHEDLPRLFTPFFSRRAGGFGLGLAISERIVGEHRGRIQAANRPGGGAVVTVSLPLTDPEPATTCVAEGAELC